MDDKHFPVQLCVCVCVSLRSVWCVNAVGPFCLFNSLNSQIIPSAASRAGSGWSWAPSPGWEVRTRSWASPTSPWAPSASSWASCCSSSTTSTATATTAPTSPTEEGGGVSLHANLTEMLMWHHWLCASFCPWHCRPAFYTKTSRSTLKKKKRAEQVPRLREHKTCGTCTNNMFVLFSLFVFILDFWEMFALWSQCLHAGPQGVWA